MFKERNWTCYQGFLYEDSRPMEENPAGRNTVRHAAGFISGVNEHGPFLLRNQLPARAGVGTLRHQWSFHASHGGLVHVRALWAKAPGDSDGHL